MNEDAVQALKTALEPPDWWTNRARPTVREIVRRLQEQGYTVARESEVRTGPRVAQDWEGPVSSLAPDAEPASFGIARAGSTPVGTAATATATPSPSLETDAAASQSAADQQMLAALMADLESSMGAVREARAVESGDSADGSTGSSFDEDAPLSNDQRQSA
jgi:hypothetical protein